MISFIAATYNEEEEINDLLIHVYSIVNDYYIYDDESQDSTPEILQMWQDHCPKPFLYKVIPHTGLPETVKHYAKERVPSGNWVLMLDADERLHLDTIVKVKEFFDSGDAENWDYVYFTQLEIIDGKNVRMFQKAKLFRKEAISIPLHDIHKDDSFEGRGIYKEDWLVLHRKSTDKQIKREIEYLATYQKLFKEGYIDEGRLKWLQGLHHYVHPKG